MQFNQKVVLVTGASRGIGRAVATQFADAGGKIAVHFNTNHNAARDTLQDLRGNDHTLFQADLADSNQTEQLVKDVLREMGSIDILVNNAGIYEDQFITSIEYDQWQQSWKRILDVNLLGPANATYWTARHMMERGGGRIVNVSSRGAFRGEPKSPAYGASKAGLNSMSQSLAQELAPYNIFICVVAPGWVETDMTAESLATPEGEAVRAQSPLNRVARPDEVARTVLFLASEGTDFLTGCIVDVNGASYLRT